MAAPPSASQAVKVRHQSRLLVPTVASVGLSDKLDNIRIGTFALAAVDFAS
jgi:hypothetical protein